MPYTIRYIKRGREVGTESWPGKFSEAKVMVEKAVASGEYDEAEVLDDQGKKMFRRPKILRRG